MSSAAFTTTLCWTPQLGHRRVVKPHQQTLYEMNSSSEISGPRQHLFTDGANTTTAGIDGGLVLLSHVLDILVISNACNWLL